MALPPTVRQVKREAETPPANITMLEQHYSFADIAEKWAASYEFVREVFQDEPGVVRSPLKKGARLCRVPTSVMERVYQRMQQAAAVRR